MHFLYQSLIGDKPLIEQARVVSLETNLYLLEISVDGQRGLVYDNDSKPMKFSSLGQVRDRLNVFVIIQAELVHRSAYGEMIGAAEEPDNTMRLPIRLGLDQPL